MSLFDRLRRASKRRRGRRHIMTDGDEVPDEDFGGRALNSSHFHDVSYDPVDDGE